jgi:hypothetical protein
MPTATAQELLYSAIHSDHAETRELRTELECDSQVAREARPHRRPQDRGYTIPETLYNSASSGVLSGGG